MLIADTLNTKLEKELLLEKYSVLVSAASNSGDAIRGAKLFYGKKTACGTCHDVKNGYQIGPQLTKVRKETTPEFLVESILKPSESILKGYRSVNILTVDGVALSGFLVDETDDNITISIAAEAGKTREISKDDIEEMAPLKLSTMPSGLVNLCGTREGFLDLLKFVIEINQGGPKRLKQLKKQANVD
ncbi:MAG: hypothetical protein COA78_16470 [Blastopirellula sp.]|nr:MAG: hypothetical protein COA78_16470 [Blastopirellula sp.]